jgi:hypothetical protein
VRVVERVDRLVLHRKPGHRHAASDRQSVRVVCDRTVVITERETGLDDCVERLRAVAVHRVHLEIAAIVGARGPSECRISERGIHFRAAEKTRSESSPPADLDRLAARRDHGLDGG